MLSNLKNKLVQNVVQNIFYCSHTQMSEERAAALEQRLVTPPPQQQEQQQRPSMQAATTACRRLVSLARTLVRDHGRLQEQLREMESLMDSIQAYNRRQQKAAHINKKK